MQGLRWLQMTDEEMAEFLGRGGTGVLSFSTESESSPASIPVSYGYNADDQRFYHQLSFPPNSAKESLVDRRVTFVVYGREDGRWRSVIATGQLEDVTDAPYESNVIQGMWAIQLPHVDIFERPREEVSFRDFSLEPETMSGRKEVPSRS